MTTELDFGGSDPANIYTSTDDITGAFLLNEIQLNSTSPVTDVITASATTNTLNFSTNGTTPVINQNGTGAFNISAGLVLTNSLTIAGSGTGNLILSGPLTGTSTLTSNYSGGLVNFTGANTYNGSTSIQSGVVTYSGTSSSSGNAQLDVGSLSGSKAVLNINTTGTLSFGGTTQVYVGDAGASGAINQTAGTLIADSNVGNYITMGNGAGYGSYLLSGGTLMASTSTGVGGIRIAANAATALGVFTQTGGTFTLSDISQLAPMVPVLSP